MDDGRGRAREYGAVVHRLAVVTIKTLSLSALVLHFALTLLYVLPPNPIKVPLLGVLDLTIGLYARQNWSLFAPNPISANQAMLAKCLTAAEMIEERRALARAAASSGWLDLSTPFWTAFQQNRFSAYDRLIRPYSHAVRNYLSGGYALQEWDRACRENQDGEACDTHAKSLEAARTSAGPVLRKLGSVFCAEHRPDDRIVAVALRARVTPAARWSQRHDRHTARPSSDVSLGIFTIDHSIAGPGLFRAQP